MIRSLACAALLCAALPAHAALDEVLPKHAPDIASLKVAGHALRVRTRGLVREFAGPDGKVFAAMWRGNGAVDLIGLLGSHAAEYETASRKSRLGLHQVAFQTPELSVLIIQHDRYRSGTIWLPAHLPTGVKLDALR